MAEVILRAESRADLLDTYSHGISQFGEKAARSYMAVIDRAMTRLSDFPMSGPIYPGLHSSVRYLSVRRHHIFYDYDGQTVWIVRILHPAMDVGKLL